MTVQSVILIGSESLTIEAGRQIVARGLTLKTVITHSAEVRNWASDQGIPVLGFERLLAEQLNGPVDWIVSVANLELLPQSLLDLGTRGAINFHDGPLPRYAGLNAPVWALLNGEARHGITWHMIEGGIDEGRILAQEAFDIRPSDTAFTLNTRCFEAGVQSFSRVLDVMTSETLVATSQDLGQRSYFGRAMRPEGHGFLDPLGSADAALKQVRALDHGPYWNPLCSAKLRVGDQVLHVGSAERANSIAQGAPGTLTQVDSTGATLVFNDGALRLGELSGDTSTLETGALARTEVLSQGTKDALAQAARYDGFWRRKLAEMEPYTMPLVHGDPTGKTETHDMNGPDSAHLAEALMIAVQHMSGVAPTLALALPSDTDLITPWVPLTDISKQDAYIAKGGFARDLLVRDTSLPQAPPPVALGRVSGAALCLDDGVLVYDTGAISTQAAQLFAGRLTHIAAQLAKGVKPVDIETIPDAELALLAAWQGAEANVDTTCIAQMIEAQAARIPDQTALVIDDARLSYAELNAAANRAAHVLGEMGVGPDVLVGLYTTRSMQMMIGALAILKAGGAYVPLDPAYPEHRIKGYLEDSAVSVIVTESLVSNDLPAHKAQLLVLDDHAALTQASPENPDPRAGPENLAYLIFTSGSTGRPKGVMIEHRNLNNFVAGMDARLAHDPAGTWLAVTSLNFDISVLELFYSLARGFKLVVTSGESRTALSNGPVTGAGIDGGMEFSLYYWGNDDGAGERKYELLLEGAKFADANGFCAVWTPERHFHAFGGPYPNPSVTGAAVAAVTKNIGVRAGSCVAPLHHPARIAEEWAVIDNLTNGRAGLAIASGWQPDDFVLRPENTPPENKPAMMQSIETLRKLWRGDPVAFPKSNGTAHEVITQPRPVSKDVPIWVTTAGNPETWKEAGRIGAHVLTHLLGQSIDEVAGKITLYHEALREAGHDPADFKVTLMLHTFIAETRELAREIAREPMKDYLRSAAGLIKQYAWAFPAFKRPKGVDNAFQLDLGSLEEDELESILDFAFQRYFDDSGLFGTVQDCTTRVAELAKIGVSEVACLIDYGIGTQQVLSGLRPLAEVVRRTNSSGSAIAPDDFSIAAQLLRHDVTHLQCTPSMARMICLNDEARFALAGVQHIMVGGEALPGTLVADLQKAAPSAEILNMYGPTETTIWSSVQSAGPVQGNVPLGQPIANTQFHVMDAQGTPCEIGASGELWIGGAGVARGYWQRNDLTAERFVQTPTGRCYKTGDLVRYTADGTLEFLGRVDHQIKLRGYRIELGEIEAALETQPGVRQAIVTAREDTPGDVRLIGYVTGDGLVPAALRAALKHALPDHMVPAGIEVLAAFPLTPNKKVDRGALPMPKAATTPDKPVAQAPSATPNGADVLPQIADIWKAALGLPSVAPSDNFFDIGGHSLLAVQVHRDIRDRLGAKLSITDIFRFPVLSALAGRIQEQGGLAISEQTVQTPEHPVKPVSNDRALSRAQAMEKRRAMRAARLGRA